jgi:hypothetical protein
LTLDAALVLVAEYHRRIKISGYKPVIDDNHWDPKVRVLFEQLGMYNLVEAVGRTAEGPMVMTPPGALRFVQFHSGTKVEQREARKLIDSLKDAAGHEPEREYVYAALVEAIKNVKHHAYPDADEYLDRLPTVSTWWAAGAFDPDQQVLQFVVYDQGVGIPATLPRQTFFQSVRRLCPLEWNDADVIAGGIRYGRTRFRSGGKEVTVQPRLDAGADSKYAPSGRGNGLWAICHFIPQLEGSSVRIMSGHGEVVYSGGRAVTKVQHVNPFCGTLIQWTLKLPANQTLAREAA